jgi:hypothetical protein
MLNSVGLFVADTVYYAGANGLLTSVVPVSGILAKIGVSVDADNIDVSLSQPIIIA